MRTMTKQNLRNIRCRFAEKTGVELTPAPRRHFPVGKVWVIVAAVLACLAMAAFASPLFSSLNGDELSLSGTYEGNGIVSVQVENRSDRKLEFQHKTRLMRWVTAQELPRSEGEAVFENTVFPPHSGGTMRIDLSAAYDMQAIEKAYHREEWFYLLLTNNNFLFGQDWMCSICLGQSEPEPKPEAAEPSAAVEAEVVEEVEESLRFYFEEAYGTELMAFNGPNFQYQQKVEELLARFEGTVVPALSPTVMVGGPTEFLDPEPVMGKPPEGVILDDSLPPEAQYLLTFADWTYTDGYGRMVASADEKAWAQTAMLPQYQGQTDGGVSLPLIFLFVYDAELAKPENHAFIYGKLHSFAELEEYKVLEDAHYAIYDATNLIYTDLDAYLDYFLACRPEVYCDSQIRQRVKTIYAFYQNPENIRQMYGYLQFPE